MSDVYEEASELCEFDREVSDYVSKAFESLWEEIDYLNEDAHSFLKELLDKKFLNPNQRLSFSEKRRLTKIGKRLIRMESSLDVYSLKIYGFYEDINKSEYKSELSEKLDEANSSIGEFRERIGLYKTVVFNLRWGENRPSGL